MQATPTWTVAPRDLQVNLVPPLPVGSALQRLADAEPAGSPSASDPALNLEKRINERVDELVPSHMRP